MADLDRLLASAAARLDREAPSIGADEVTSARVLPGLDDGVDDGATVVSMTAAVGPGSPRRSPVPLRVGVALATAAAVVVGLVVVTRRDHDRLPAGPVPTVSPSTTAAATTTQPAPATTAEPVLPTLGPVPTAAAGDPTPRLSGIGIGEITFGADETAAVTALTRLLGAPIDGGPVAPQNTATPVANGCANLTEEVRFFPHGIVVGFQEGRFAAWSAWAGGFGTDADPSLRTTGGVALGQTEVAAARLAGDAYRPIHTTLPQARINTVDGVVTDSGGTILVAVDRGLTSDGSIRLLTAGVGCEVPAQPDEVAPVVDWSRFAPPTASGPGLDAVERLMPTQVPASLDTPHRLDARSGGAGSDAEPPAGFMQVFAPSPKGQLLELTTLAYARTFVEPATYTLGPWHAYVQSTAAPGFAEVILADATGTIDLWGQGLTSEQLRAFASALRQRTDGPGWDIGVPPLSLVFEGWSGGSAAAYRYLEWGDIGSGPRAELTQGQIGPSARAPMSSASVEVADVAGRRLVVYRLDTITVVLWRDSATSAGQLATRDITVAEAVAMVTSLAPVGTATWDALPQPVDTGSDGCASLLC